MTKRWHFWVITIVIIIGLIVAFWPAPVSDGAPAASVDQEQDQEEKSDKTGT